MSKIIAVLNQKGGVGKTTTTISLAAYWAKMGKRVLIVDADPQGNATSGLGVDKQAAVTTYQLMLGHTTVSQAAVDTQTEGVSIVPANNNLATVEIELADMAGRERKLRDALQALSYDVVLIDCPPALGLITVNALVAADLLLIPVQAEYYALEGLGQLLEVFRRVKQSVNPHIRLLGIAVTMYDSRTTLSDQVVEQLQKHFGEFVFETKIPRNVRLAEAPSHGRPISEHDKWSKGARAYKQLAKEIWERV
ncbi:ParA family protein [Candidatus Saccharibacteria bacterium]|nr:ParA family protein [Candidatus Saccharibacteria bacterium]